MRAVTADRTKQEARVIVEGSTVSSEQIIAAIQGAGKFQAKLAG